VVAAHQADTSEGRLRSASRPIVTTTTRHPNRTSERHAVQLEISDDLLEPEHDEEEAFSSRR